MYKTRITDSEAVSVYFCFASNLEDDFRINSSELTQFTEFQHFKTGRDKCSFIAI
jgi:hypothetical protein